MTVSITFLNIMFFFSHIYRNLLTHFHIDSRLTGCLKSPCSYLRRKYNANTSKSPCQIDFRALFASAIVLLFAFSLYWIVKIVLKSTRIMWSAIRPKDDTGRKLSKKKKMPLFNWLKFHMTLIFLPSLNRDTNFGIPCKKGPDKRCFIARNLRGVRGKRKKGEKLAESWRLAFTFANNQTHSLFLLFRACHAGYIMHNRAFNSILLSTALTSLTPSPRKKKHPRDTLHCTICYIAQYAT